MENLKKALIEQAKSDFDSTDLVTFVEQFIAKMSDNPSNSIVDFFSQKPSRITEFLTATYGSKYLQKNWLINIDKFTQFAELSDLDQTWNLETYNSKLAERTQGVDTEQLAQQLRLFRQMAMCRIIWRDFNRIASTQETTAELSALATASIQYALNFHYHQLAQKLGYPKNKAGVTQPMLILGMGKLGAGELNLSSDIDLIFCYPESGETDHPQKNLTNQEFFTRLGKAIIQSLDRQTADGFVFRVDMRLRPYGESGPLVSNFNSMENYYQTQGREWERYAMIKARVIATTGEATYTEELMKLLRNFTFRQYIDFSVIEALRKLKRMINQEVARRQLQEDVKLGSGGIREIEFIAQAFQLIRGGRERALQDNRLLTILPLLEEFKSLPEGKAKLLSDAYCFLRNVEHAVQGYEDKQTQKLPVDDKQKTILAKIMGFEHWDAFYQTLEQHREVVREEFHEVVADPNQQDQAQLEDFTKWSDVWHLALDMEACINLLQEHNHEDAEQSYEQIRSLAKTSRTGMHATGRERLDEFMPRLLAQVAKASEPSATLKRILHLVKAVMRRSAYLLLLNENPKALGQLIKLTQASPWIADQITKYPALLDELLDPSSLYSPPEKADLEDELRRLVLRIDENDLEAQMEALRYFRSSHALRVAACEITGALPLMKVSDYLTYIAEVILDYILRYCWNQMVARHGYPGGQMSENPKMIIVGYGKLGGIEMGHKSDLDLVFIHNAKSNGSTDGEKPLDNPTFFMRLGQKIIHFLTTNMHSGQLYDTDMRLRPDGSSGMLVPSIQAFHKYQKDKAWTWEHQALCRARVVAGDPELTSEFEQIRAEILQTPRDLTQLKKDVIDMRIKMREHLGSDKQNLGDKLFDLKQDPGGIVDIEFMVQYAVLAWANTEPALVKFTDNIRILESLAQSNLLATQEVEQLIEAYKVLRAEGHRLTLQHKTRKVPGDQLVAERQKVIAIWNKLLETQP